MTKGKKQPRNPGAEHALMQRGEVAPDQRRRLADKSRQLRALRKSAGLSQGALAEAAGLGRCIISELERQGRSAQKRRHLAHYAHRLAKVLGPRVYDLAGGSQLALEMDWLRAEKLDGPATAAAARTLLREAVKCDLSLGDRPPEAAVVWRMPGPLLVVAPATSTRANPA